MFIGILLAVIIFAVIGLITAALQEKAQADDTVRREVLREKILIACPERIAVLADIRTVLQQQWLLQGELLHRMSAWLAASGRRRRWAWLWEQTQPMESVCAPRLCVREGAFLPEKSIYMKVALKIVPPPLVLAVEKKAVDMHVWDLEAA